MKTLFITGITGFIGRHLIDKIDRKKYKLKCLVRKSSNYDFLEKKAELVFGDIKDFDSFSDSLKNVDIVIHLAADLKNITFDKLYETNVSGTKNLIKACMKYGIKRVIVASSSATLLEKRSAYGETKNLADEMLIQNNFDYTILKPGLVYGNGCIGFDKVVDYVKKFKIIPIIGDGNTLMQPVYIGDVIDAIINCIDNKKTIKKVYELGGKYPISFNDFIDLVSIKVCRRKKSKIHIPIPICKLMATLSKNMKNRPLTHGAILTFIQDGSLHNEDAIKDLKYNPLPVEEGLAKIEIN